jgi:LysR family glycine cleavage system transcriptional activator
VFARGHDAELPGLGQLQVLEVLSRRGQMTVAAAEMGVSHAAVSQGVSRLEERFGAKLFVRSQGRFSPTPGCLELVDAYLLATRLIGRAVQTAFAPARGLTVSLPRYAAMTWLAGGLGRLCGAVPGVLLRVHADEAAPDFADCDAALVIADAAPPGCRGELLFDESVVPVCAPRLIPGGETATADFLRDLPILTHRRRLWRDWFLAQTIDPPTLDDAIEVTDAALGLQAALEGHGLFLACVVTAAGALRTGRLVAPVPRSITTGRRLWLLWPAGAARHPAVDSFADWLRRELEDAPRVLRRPSPTLGARRAFTGLDGLSGRLEEV